MKKQMKIFALSLAMLLGASVLKSHACTNFLITKGASKDGSTMVSYAADSHQLYGSLYHWPAAKYEEGAMLDIYEWDTGKYLGKIKQVGETYNVVGNMNEHQLAIGETTYGGRSELGSQPGAIMDYGSLIYVTLQRAKNAREAIKTLSELMAEYGYASSGESFSIADPNEVWIMELIGKGRTYEFTKDVMKDLKQSLPQDIYKKVTKLSGKSFFVDSEFEKAILDALNLEKKESKEYLEAIKTKVESKQKGAIWVAKRVPDGYVCAHANQARITTFEYQKENKWNDPEANTFNAPDVISFAKEKKFYEGDDKDFSFSDVYAPVDFGGARFCEMRVYAFFKDIAKEIKDNKMYWEYVKGNVKHPKGHESGAPFTKENFASNRMPLWVKPDEKIDVHQVMNFMRDHLEGTELDMSKDLGAGPFANPYRWRPLTWKVDDKTYCNERATATQQTGFSFVTQSRSWLPNPVGGIIWFGVDDAASSVYAPMYCGITTIPNTFAEGNGSMMDWSNKSAFWIFNQVTNLAYTRYSEIHPEIAGIQQALEKKYIAYRDVIDVAAKTLYEKDQELAVQFITDYSVNTGNALFETWKKFYQYLFMKYKDGNIMKSKGMKILDNGNIVVPAGPDQPGYGEDWYKRIVNETGEQFLMPGGDGH